MLVVRRTYKILMRLECLREMLRQRFKALVIAYRVLCFLITICQDENLIIFVALNSNELFTFIMLLLFPSERCTQINIQVSRRHKQMLLNHETRCEQVAEIGIH